MEKRMTLSKVKKLIIGFSVLLAVSCKCTLEPYSVPRYRTDKELKYSFAAYYNTKGEKVFQLYISDSIYTAEAKKNFNIFKDGYKAVQLNPTDKN